MRHHLVGGLAHNQASRSGSGGDSGGPRSQPRRVWVTDHLQGRHRGQPATAGSGWRSPSTCTHRTWRPDRLRTWWPEPTSAARTRSPPGATSRSRSWWTECRWHRRIWPLA